MRNGEMMRVLRWICLGALVFALITSVAIPSLSSGAGSDSTLRTHDGDARAETRGLLEQKVLVIAMAMDIETMDPIKTSSMCGPPGMIYETLIARDKAGVYVPGLAESWEMKDLEGTSYLHRAVFNLTLKQGVKFHDGTSFDSDAVRRIINYYAQNDSWMQYAFWAIYGCQNKTGWPFAGIWCIDDYHVTFNLTWADQALTFNLSNLYGSMMSPSALESDGIEFYGTPGHKVVGTGPFTMLEWMPGDHVTLVKNENYTWGASWYDNKGPAKIDQIVYRIEPDAAARYAGFENGTIDILQQVSPNKVETYQNMDGVEVMTGPGQGTYHLDFNCQVDPWTTPSLRSAFGYAVNRTQILQTVWHGIGEEGVNYLAPIVLESRRVPSQYNFTYNITKSNELFLAAGWQNMDADGWLENSIGEELTLQLWTTTKGEDIAMSQMLKIQFEAVGVHVVLTAYAETTLRDKAASGEHEAILFWYSWPRVEILDWQFGSWAMGGSNMAWFSDGVFDNFVTNWTYAETESDFSDNATAGHIRLLTQAPRVPIIYWHNIDVIHDYLSGWYLNPFGRELVFDIVDVDLDRAPTAVALVTPNPAMAGEPVTFDATGSSDDGGIVNWTWTFTDGGIPVNLWEENVTYAFTDAFQMVDVTLTVQDGEGNSDSDTVTLEIVGLIPEFRTILAPVVVAIVAGVFVGFERRLKI